MKYTGITPHSTVAILVNKHFENLLKHILILKTKLKNFDSFSKLPPFWISWCHTWGSRVVIPQQIFKMATALRAVEFYSGIGGMHYALQCKLESNWNVWMKNLGLGIPWESFYMNFEYIYSCIYRKYWNSFTLPKYYKDALKNNNALNDSKWFIYCSDFKTLTYYSTVYS